MSFHVGATVAGKYWIERILGRGGMGTVLLARHERLDRLVALKLLRADASEGSTAGQRLLREGRALARLRNEHIARVLDVEVPENGPMFLVLEYLEGHDLGTVIERAGPLTTDVAVMLFLQVCEALSEAHAHGIVHRDIKPANLLLTTLPDGSCGVKVIDFGISKHLQQDTTLTESRSVVGSPRYMAPEQLRSSPTIDARCDIWALGVVLYEMLVGRPPYTGDSVLQLCASILESEPKSLQQLRPDVPDVIGTAIRKCLALDPDDRFASVDELALSIASAMGNGTPRCDKVAPKSQKLLRKILSHCPAVSGGVLNARTLSVEDCDRTFLHSKSQRRHLAWPLCVLLAVATGSAPLRAKRIESPNGTFCPQIQRPAVLLPQEDGQAGPEAKLDRRYRTSQPSRLQASPTVAKGASSPNSAIGKTPRLQRSSADHSHAHVPLRILGIAQDPILQYGHY
jgi:serine/threonine-protein kinase